MSTWKKHSGRSFAFLALFALLARSPDLLQSGIDPVTALRQRASPALI
jgi:hypothetical protein